MEIEYCKKLTNIIKRYVMLVIVLWNIMEHSVILLIWAQIGSKLGTKKASIKLA